MKRVLSVDNPFFAPLLATSILISAHMSFGVLEGYSRTGTAIIVAILAELVMGRLSYGKWPRLAMAYVTGISCGMLVRSPFVWPYAMAGLISIVTKYVLRLKGRHVCNPSNFGVTAVLFLAPGSVSLLGIQWGNTVWPMIVIWILGLAIGWRARRLNMTATYVASFVAFAYVRSAITGNSFLSTVAPLTGPMYQLYIFFMITDPKTTVNAKWGQAVTVVVVALVEAVMRLNEVLYAPFYALFLVAPPALLIEMWWTSRQSARLPPAF